MSESGVFSVRTSTAFRLMVLFSSFFVLLIVAGGIGAAVASIPGIGERDAILITSAVQCVVAFCIPAWITGRFSSPHPSCFLGLRRKSSYKAYVGVVIVYFLALPAMNQLIEWNASIHFPEWASGIESTLRGWEKAAGDVSSKVLASGSVWEMLCGVAVVGVLTGFSEEIFFRGSLQKIFLESGIGRGWAIWCAAAIFSAVHFQFFGFLPRLLMGVFFGYLFVWSGSLWPAVFAHALNNSIVVVGGWLYGDNVESGIDRFGLMEDGGIPWTAVASVIATVLFFYRFRESFFKGGISESQ
ncbi:MAG: CPBP family intramembrane metalloprotease [Muribaculaceae bacterium]|nr:CPBP family intramembrane metalloprotease [Muribaculaceae bacterium]MDE6534213.1 CPBP family intramembrane metalloprotease [Muribaculaceae bacterium]